jgi:GNAT superfamily N-acetyltransferase
MVSTVVNSLYTRRDVDPAHRSLWVAAKERINREHWSARPQLLYLSGLYTYPPFHGMGAGRLLKEWGLAVARRHRAAVGVVASHPPSVTIYKHWGFEQIAMVRLQREGESAHVDLSVLLYEP